MPNTAPAVPFPPPRVVREYSPLVAAWLATFSTPALSRWFLGLLDVERVPLQALWLHGRTNAGKTLFARAVSRIWSLQLRAHTDRFNEWQTPVVIFDELAEPSQLPQDFRELVSSNRRAANVKHKPMFERTGYARVVVCSNTPLPVLDENEPRHTNAAVDAFAVWQRLLPVAFTEASHDALVQFNVEIQNDPDMIARHLLHVVDEEKAKDRAAITAMVSSVQADLIDDEAAE